MTRQQQLCNNKWFRLAVSVILTFAVLLVFVFSPFAEAHAVGALDTELIDIIIAGLSACGITFTTTGGFGSLEDHVSNLIDEYAVDQNTTALGLLNGAQYGNNKLGQLLLNNRLVRFISAFATYIKVKYSLANNNNQVLVDGSIVNGIITTKIPYSYIAVSSGIKRENYYVSSTDPVYLVFYRSKVGGSTYYNTMAYSSSEFTIVWSSRDMPNGTPAIQQFDGELYNTSYFVNVGSSSSQSWTATGSTAPIDKVYIDPSSNVANTVYNHIRNALDGEYPAGDTIGINTGVINPPLDDSNYEDGDGALVDVGSTWGATLKDILDKIRLNWENVQAGNQDISMEYASEKEVGEQLPEQTDIENLPGGTAWNPTDQQLKFFEFESIWHYVAQWIQDFTAGASVVWNTAVQLPSPMVNMVYAMVTLAIIFGVIKVMRA